MGGFHKGQKTTLPQIGIFRNKKVAVLKTPRRARVAGGQKPTSGAQIIGPRWGDSGRSPKATPPAWTTRASFLLGCPASIWPAEERVASRAARTPAWRQLFLLSLLTATLPWSRILSGERGEQNLPLKVAVSGGSLAGLCVGITLRGIGCDVDVYERTPGAMTSRGAGIVVQEDLLNLLHRHGAPELPAVSCAQRLYLQPEGGDGVATPMPQRFTSWYAIYKTLRSLFPDERYHQGWNLTGFEQAMGRVVARFAERGQVEVDLLACADGSQSETRRRLLPDIEPRYAGYVAWRGTIDEARVPPGLARFFDQSFTFCESR